MLHGSKFLGLVAPNQDASPFVAGFFNSCSARIQQPWATTTCGHVTKIMRVLLNADYSVDQEKLSQLWVREFPPIYKHNNQHNRIRTTDLTKRTFCELTGGCVDSPIPSSLSTMLRDPSPRSHSLPACVHLFLCLLLTGSICLVRCQREWW